MRIVDSVLTSGGVYRQANADDLVKGWAVLTLAYCRKPNNVAST